MKAQMIVALLALACGASSAAAQTPPALTRTNLVRHDLGAQGYEGLQVRVDFPPGASSAAHTHPGEEIAYVLQGTLEYVVAGGAPVTLHAGEVLFIPARTVHSARNVGPGVATELATYIVLKDQPLIAPAR